MCNCVTEKYVGVFLVIGAVFLSAVDGAVPAVRRSLYPEREPAGLETHPLIIKTYPGVDNYQSDIYEVYAEPYPYVSLLQWIIFYKVPKDTNL